MWQRINLMFGIFLFLFLPQGIVSQFWSTHLGPECLPRTKEMGVGRGICPLCHLSTKPSAKIYPLFHHVLGCENTCVTSELSTFWSWPLCYLHDEPLVLHVALPARAKVLCLCFFPEPFDGNAGSAGMQCLKSRGEYPNNHVPKESIKGDQQPRGSHHQKGLRREGKTVHKWQVRNQEVKILQVAGRSQSLHVTLGFL